MFGISLRLLSEGSIQNTYQASDLVHTIQSYNRLNNRLHREKNIQPLVCRRLSNVHAAWSAYV